MMDGFNLQQWSFKLNEEDIILRVGDVFEVDGYMKKLTKIDTASDELGIYACYLYIDDDFCPLRKFYNRLKNGEIKLKSQIRENKINLLFNDI